MSTIVLVLQIISLVASVVLIIAVLMQSAKSAGLGGAYGGDTQSFTARGKAASRDAKLQKITVICGVALGVLTLVIMILSNHIS